MVVRTLILLALFIGVTTPAEAITLRAAVREDVGWGNSTTRINWMHCHGWTCRVKLTRNGVEVCRTTVSVENIPGGYITTSTRYSCTWPYTRDLRR